MPPSVYRHAYAPYFASLLKVHPQATRPEGIVAKAHGPLLLYCYLLLLSLTVNATVPALLPLLLYFCIVTFRLARSAHIARRRSTVPVTPVYLVTPCKIDVCHKREEREQ